MKSLLKKLKDSIVETIDAKHKSQYNYSKYLGKRKEILGIMQEMGIDKYTSHIYTFNVHKYWDIDEDLLLQKYPEIYDAGLEFKFNLYKARKTFPAHIVNKALLDCGVKEESYVKVSQKTRIRHADKRKIQQITRFNNDFEKDTRYDDTLRNIRENRIFGYSGHYARLKHRRIQRHKVNSQEKGNVRPRKTNRVQRRV